jgi:hypothetical protein
VLAFDMGTATGHSPEWHSTSPLAGQQVSHVPADTEAAVGGLSSGAGDPFAGGAQASHRPAMSWPSRSAETTSRQRKPLAWPQVGQDNRDRELEVISVEIGAGREAFLPVMQVKPVGLRKWGDPGV